MIKLSRKDDKNLRLIPYTIGKFFHNQGNNELLSAGYKGYYQAKRAYNPKISAFSTFAIKCIKTEIVKQIIERKKNKDELVEDIENFSEESNHDKLEIDEILNKVNLSEKEQDLLKLYYYDNLKFCDIAEIENVTTQRIQQRLDIILKKIRKKLNIKGVKND